MTRREIGWLVVRAAAVAGGPQFFADWVKAAPPHAGPPHAHELNSFAPPEPDRWSSYQPKFLSAEEFKMLDAFTAILIPTDETPGAREAHVTPFIDFVINAAAEYAPEMQREWRKSMNWLAGRQFGQLSGEEQLSLVRQMSEEGDGSSEGKGFAVYQLIRDMTIHAFYTSRAGLVDVLEYKGYAYLTEFPACTHPEHHQV